MGISQQTFYVSQDNMADIEYTLSGMRVTCFILMDKHYDTISEGVSKQEFLLHLSNGGSGIAIIKGNNPLNFRGELPVRFISSPAVEKKASFKKALSGKSTAWKPRDFTKFSMA